MICCHLTFVSSILTNFRVDPITNKLMNFLKYKKKTLCVFKKLQKHKVKNVKFKLKKMEVIMLIYAIL